MIKIHAHVTKKSDSSLAGTKVSGGCYKPLGNGCESAPLCVPAKKLRSCLCAENVLQLQISDDQDGFDTNKP